MSEEREPVRLRDDPSEDAGLREMLDAARGERADDAMLERVLAGVLAGGGGGGGSSAPSATGTSAAVKLAAATTAIVATAGTIALLVTSDPAPPRPVPTAPSLAVVDAARSLDAGSDASVVVDVDERDAATEDMGRPTTARVRAPAPATTTTPALDDGPLLLAATRARAADPAGSLALALEHRARFPGSAGAEDREALVVLDLAALGRAPEARAAADSFRARWPRSAHLPHLDAALARLP